MWYWALLPSFSPQSSLSVIVVHLSWKPSADLSISHAHSQRVKSHWPGQQGCFTGLRALRREAICLHQPPQPNAWGIRPLACPPTRAPSLSLFFRSFCAKRSLCRPSCALSLKKLNQRKKKISKLFLGVAAAIIAARLQWSLQICYHCPLNWNCVANISLMEKHLYSINYTF